MPKHTDEPAARAAAVDAFAEIVHTHGHDITGEDVADEVRNRFPIASFERSTTRVKGETVPLRRVHLIGEWAVDPNPGAAPASTTRTTT